MSSIEINTGGSTSINTPDISVNPITVKQEIINVTVGGITAASDAHFVFSQEVVSRVWEVEHNLNKYPSVTIVDAGGNILYTEVEYIDKNNLEVRFEASTSGKAYMN